MSTSTWRGPELHSADGYPSTLLKNLLKQLVGQLVAQGACIALFDPEVGQMRIKLHVRLRGLRTPLLPSNNGMYGSGVRYPDPRLTVPLESSPSLYPPFPHATDELEEISAQQCEMFAPESSYHMGQDLIGSAWAHKEAYIMRHEDYVSFFYSGRPLPFHADILPSAYLVAPIHEPMLVDEMRGAPRQTKLIGVIVLYRVAPMGEFSQKQRSEAIQSVERIALYLQNYRLQRVQHRTSEYVRLLQDISATFPTTVKFSELVNMMYQFTTQVADVSSMLLTIYDRDFKDGKEIVDVPVMCNGVRVNEASVDTRKESCPIWWKTTQEEKRIVQFSPTQDVEKAKAYRELLTGAWGDQTHTASFLLLPMKMFNRVTGSLCITSMQPNVFDPETVRILETMLHIVTVGIENMKLYNLRRSLKHDAKVRDVEMARLSSALQSISSVLNVNELLNNLVESGAEVAKVRTCVFFQFSPERDELIAQALYAPTSVRMVDDGSGLPELNLPRSKTRHEELIKMIRLPFKGTILEQLVHQGFFYLDAPKLEELALRAPEGCAIFLQEMNIKQLMMIPLTYQNDMIGILAVPTPSEHHFFRHKDITILLAISAQAVGAIRNAQLFEELAGANAELERLNKLKDEFLVTASHELRTPMQAIIGYSGLLKRHCQSARVAPQDILRYSNKIAGAAQQLQDLVDNMTEAAKIGADDKQLNLDLEPVQVLAAAEFAVNMLNVEQKISFDVDKTLWVRGSPLHLRQVLSNLLENAAKYSPSQGSIYVSTSAMTLVQVEDLLSEDQLDPELFLEKGNMPVVLVRVRDQGEGIRPQDQERIFEKFVRAPRSLTTPVRGSGLGLYICRRYIEAMGGKLWLEQSTLNEGSTFSFYLPRVDSPVEVRSATQS